MGDEGIASAINLFYVHVGRALDKDGYDDGSMSGEMGKQVKVMVIHKTPTLTRERYEQVVRGLTGGKSRLESPDDVPTGGLL
ncbi:MAG TPA: hypothetical protein VGX22_01405, partial [Candidatus Dormibacteraeota bacterium]|nr:hypothetical protein [Candidatus Dormibacteraeota bacterium]